MNHEPNIFRGCVMMFRIGIVNCMLVIALTSHVHAEPLQFETQELAERLTVGYAVRAIDMNDDGRPDIVVLDSKRLIWLENPTWKLHTVYATPDARFDNVCFAPADIDGDGDRDFALGADWQFGNTRSGGTIGWLEQKAQDSWIYHSISSEPTTHRMRWMNVGETGSPKLIVAPLKGRGTTAPGFAEAGVRLLAFSIPADPTIDPWPSSVLTDSLHVMHNIDICDLDADGQNDLLAASFEGVHWLSSSDGQNWTALHIGEGDQERPAPKLGSSEIRLGRLADKTPVVATIEPWHGDRVVTYHPADSLRTMWNRFVLDADLAWGHAVAFANLDDDPDEELVIGVRDNLSDAHRSGVRVYDPVEASAGKWNRTIVDPGGVAVEDLATGDFDQDGKVDIVAVGRKTKNIRIYWNRP